MQTAKTYSRKPESQNVECRERIDNEFKKLNRNRR